MVTDYIADLIIRIKNGSDSGKEVISFPHSKLGESISHVLLNSGYIKSIELNLLYVDGAPRVHGVKRISHLSKRMYQKSKDIRNFKNGFGNVIYSTPKGILTDIDAKKQNVGGEILFKIW